MEIEQKTVTCLCLNEQSEPHKHEVRVFIPVDVLKQNTQGPSLQNKGARVHSMLKGERVSPTGGVMLQDGGGKAYGKVLIAVVGLLKEVPEVDIIYSVDEAWVWGWDAGCPVVA